MAKEEWYRRTTWTTQDRADFESRLKRSRSVFHKAQYLRIQAYHLQEVGTAEMLRAALDLLHTLIADYPDPTQLGAALTQQGDCFSELGEHDRAIDSYRTALECQRRTPSVQGQAYLRFGELVVALKRSDLYPEVLAVLDEFGGNEMFPVERYTAATTRALISDESGHPADAQISAQKALAALHENRSPFPRHPRVGLVRFVDPEVLERLRGLA